MSVPDRTEIEAFIGHLGGQDRTGDDGARGAGPQHHELFGLLQNAGKDPSRLVFEDELTGLYNRRFLHSYLEQRVRWDDADGFPLSMLIIDVDHFKQVNDTLGHDAGDQAIRWVAGLLKETVGDEGLPVRYGGDEFIVLAPGADRQAARELGNRLLSRVRESPVELDDSETVVSLTLSIGVATALDDADGRRALARQADNALYQAKQSGRDQLASVDEIDAEKGSSRTALHRLEEARIAGRKGELRVVSDALDQLRQRKSSVLLLEGAPGMGKTTLLQSIRASILDDAASRTVEVSGLQAESYRPYYLASQILVALVDQGGDEGRGVLTSLSAEEVAHLNELVPHLLDDDTRPDEGHEKESRRDVFFTLVRVLTALLGSRRLILLVDDLHLADEATLNVLRVLTEGSEVAALICGTTMEMLVEKDGATPLERFLSVYGQDLGVQRVPLPPLGAEDIAEHVQAVFPGVELPRGLVRELARVTQGNPLFLAEVIRKLVMDQKVRLLGQQWTIEALEKGYLPRSLEEIVSEKIAALDAESREMLAHASTLGEGAAVSLLTGSTEVEESRVLEFLDRAESMGLIRVGFRLNDDSMQFLSRRVLEICYGAIQPDRREELHERVGSYHEGLYGRNLQSSASILAYHFKRSARHEKAQRYEQVQLAHDRLVFDIDEATTYSAEPASEDREPKRELPELQPESLPLIPLLLSSLLIAVRSRQLYPAESASIVQSRGRLGRAIEAVLEANEVLALQRHERQLIANGQSLQVSEYRTVAESFVELMNVAELREIRFLAGVQEAELKALIEGLVGSRRETRRSDFWKEFSSDHGLEHVRLRQMQYVSLPGQRGPGRADPTAADPEVLPALGLDVAWEETLDPEELQQVPQVMRSLLAAATNIKLYPIGAEQVSSAIDQIHGSLEALLASRPVLTLLMVEGSLVANGEKVDTQDYEALAVKFAELLASVGLTSLTFREGLPREEIEAFVEELRDPPAVDVQADYWASFTREKGLSKLALNRPGSRSAVVEEEATTAVRPAGARVAGDGHAGETAIRSTESAPQKPQAALGRAVPEQGRALLAENDREGLAKLLEELFEAYGDQDSTARASVIRSCRELTEGLILALAYRFSQVASAPLLQALGEEKETRILGEIVELVQHMASGAVQFDDYAMASRLLFGIRSRLEEMAERGDPRARTLDRELDAPVRRLVSEDLRSSDPERQVRATQLLESLGRGGIPLLVQVVKEEREYRIRHLAATLLGRLGPEAGEAIKKELVLEVTAEQRFRILEVIDTVTRDLGEELIYCLRSINPKVRRGAFQLAERLKDDAVNDAVMEIAESEELAFAKGAIRCLGNSGSAASVETLVSILESSEEEERVVACVQALGQIGDDACVETLGRILSERKGLVFSRRRSGQVRATAAFALGGISDPRAAEMLARFASDSDPGVRQIALDATARRDGEG